jgi:anti-anti-sigma regulatory factor
LPIIAELANMEVSNFLTSSYIPKIEIIEISGELTGREALQLEEYLYNCLDECRGSCYKLINFKHTRKIDGLGIKVLEYFVNRGMRFTLFNVGADIQNMIRMSGKENVFKICEEKDFAKAVSLLEREILKEKPKIKGAIKARRHPRINTSFQIEFKFTPGHNGETAHKANALNLSEGGLFADRIITINKETGKTVDDPEIAGRELHELSFALNGTSKPIVTNGQCVWITKKHENLCAGICFKDMKQNYKEMIRDFVAQNQNKA